MSVFRLNRWVTLDGALNQFRFRKAVAAMSVSAVDEAWLSSEARLTRGEARALLDELRREGALVELPELVLYETAGSSRRSSLGTRLRRWLAGGGVGFEAR